MSESITVRVPSTIGNVGVGFDVLGMALDHVGEEITLTKRNDSKLVIRKLESAIELPTDPDKNCATVTIQHYLKAIDSRQGFDVEIKKFVRPGSGLGSSAASSAGAVYAANLLMGTPLSTKALLPFALEGERIACGSPIPDNAAPALLGGITLVREAATLDVIALPCPHELYVSLIYPEIDIKTEDARKILKGQVPLKTAIRQWADLAAFVSALYTDDYDLISRSLRDHVVEPMRAILIPGFAEVKQAAIDTGALGASISGAGPSIFALSKSKEKANQVLKAMQQTLKAINLPYQSFVSGVNQSGIQTVKS